MWDLYLENVFAKLIIYEKSPQTCCVDLLLMLKKLILVLVVASTTLMINLRSSTSEVFLEKGVLKLCRKFT